MKRFITLVVTVVGGLGLSGPAVVEAQQDRVYNQTQDRWHPTIQAAIDAADSGDELIAGPGVYTEAINYLGKDVILRSVNPDDPATVAATVIDADLDANPGTSEGPAVTFENGETRQAVLAGFIIRGGTGKDCPEDGWPFEWALTGGGIYCRQASPTIRQNIIAGNSSFLGGGAHFAGGSPLFERNIVRENRATHSGGGVKAINSCTAVIRNNLVIANRTQQSGGGGLDLFNCPAGAAPAVRHNDIMGNHSPAAAAGIACSNASPAIRNNIIAYNTGTAGVYADAGSTPDICYNDLWQNPAGHYAGTAAGCQGGSLLSNPQFAQESTGTWTSGGVFDAATFRTTLTDTSAEWADGELVDRLVNPDAGQSRLFVVVANTAQTIVVVGDASGLAGAGDTYRIHNPHIGSSSPCRNAGDPGFAPDAQERELDGEARLTTARVDIGADEYPQACRVRNLTRNTCTYNIQNAINGAGRWDEIVVEPDFYNEAIDFLDRKIILRSTDPGDPDVVAATVIDGTGLDKCVVTLAGGVLSGFTIQGGDISDAGPNAGGVNASDDAVVTNNVVKENFGDDRFLFGHSAGGIIASGDAVIADNEITGNRSLDSSAAGVVVIDRAVLIGNWIVDNSPEGGGGGVGADDEARVVGNTILSNWGNPGGGVLASGHSIVEGNIIEDNYDDSTGGGGGIYAYEHVIIRSNFIIDNGALGGAGGVQAEDAVQVFGNTIVDNWIDTDSGGVGVSLGADAWCVNNIIAFNHGTEYNVVIDGAGLVRDYNCIYGNNDCGEFSCPLFSSGGPGPHDILEDPRLDVDNLHLLPDSPCIDVGHPDYTYVDLTDIDGDPRRQACRVDIGADEVVPVAPPVPSAADFDADCDVDGGDLLILNACATGPTVPYDPQNLPAGCLVAPVEDIIPPDLDADGDVDQEDFGLFQRLYLKTAL